MNAILTTICTLLLLTAFGQESNSTEQMLLRQFKKINYWAEYKSVPENLDKYDSSVKANEDFQKLLLIYTSQNSSTLTFAFKELDKEGLSIATSADGLFRIYSWDTYTGGTMHVFDNVYQYKANGKVFSKISKANEDEYNPGYWYSTIYSMSSAGKTFYLGLRQTFARYQVKPIQR